MKMNQIPVAPKERAAIIERYGTRLGKRLKPEDVLEIKRSLDLSARLAREVCLKIDTQARTVPGKWVVYKAQFVLENLIEKLKTYV